MQKGTNLCHICNIFRFIILHHRPGKHDVGVSFRHMFCKRHMALQTMHHGCDVVRCVLYLFYFLELPSFLSFFILCVLFYYNIGLLQAKLAPTDIGSAQICITNPAAVDVRHLHVPIFQPFLRPWQLHEHDGHMHLFQLESVDQQSRFH